MFAGGVLAVLLGAATVVGGAHAAPADPFRQLEEILPTPTTTRTGSGAPGHAYWQQKVDYRIDVSIDDQAHRLRGSERVRYRNQSPDTLKYLWLQLDANIYSPTADRVSTATAPTFDRVPYRTLNRLVQGRTFDGSVTLTKVTDRRGRPLDYTVVGTMMRLDLPKDLGPKDTFDFEIEWSYTINDTSTVPGRTGFERFDDGNVIYEIAQWFPRLAAYEDVNGWQNKQFLGAGEFTLEFGDYDVSITMPEDYVVAATGELQNARKVLTEGQRQRLKDAETATSPVFIITPEEATANQSAARSSGTKTWRFKAQGVRDFAFAASRKFIWDAQRVDAAGRSVWAMSYYPIEGEPLWSQYSTKAIMHTLRVYGRYAFDYPYPVAISVNGPVRGMEYPMICFNGPRPEEDGTYAKRTKYRLISVIIHEVGHNFFPMIVNSDERQWTWMDEGLNTFLQYRAEQEWEAGYPSRRGEPRQIVEYMRSGEQVPIMTNSESLLQFSNNAYAKPATALNILRETVMGRELFDYAFREYAQRWKFRRPMPSDFFRTMEDASAIDLDWFWRGWFYTTDHVDIAIVSVREYVGDPGGPAADKGAERERRDATPASLSEQRDAALPKLTDQDKDLLDFYNSYDELDLTGADKRRDADQRRKLTPEERALLDAKLHYFVLELENVGGLVMPVILDVEFDSGKRKEVRIPAEVWRRNAQRIAKLLITDEPVVAVTVDPHLETADTDLNNNHWPPKVQKSRFQIYKESKEPNPMQNAGLGRGDGDEARKGKEESAQ